MGHQGEKDMRITENISIMLNCQNMIQGKCQEMAPRKTLQKPWRVTFVNCFSGSSWSTTETAREHRAILTESQAFRRRKWKKISYCLSLPLALAGKLAFSYLMEKEHCLLPLILAADMDWCLYRPEQFSDAHLKSIFCPLPLAWSAFHYYRLSVCPRNSYKWIISRYFLVLASFTQHNVLKMHPCSVYQ